MEKRLLALKLVLEELDVPVDVSSIDSRKAMQKAVYLAQSAGVPLGYGYNWYVLGPYSPGLTDDYYKMVAGGGELLERKLRGELREQLQALRTTFESSSSEGLSRPDWLELLASWHYLRTQGNSKERAQMTMDRVKPRLATRTNAAERALRATGLLKTLRA